MERDQMMLKARANLCLAQAQHSASKQARIEMAGFLDLFHPDMDDVKRQELIREAGHNVKDY